MSLMPLYCIHTGNRTRIMTTSSDRREANRRHAKTSRLRKKEYVTQLKLQHFVLDFVRRYLESLLPPAEVKKIKQRLQIEHDLTETVATMKTGAELAREFEASIDDLVCTHTELDAVSNTHEMTSSDFDVSVLDAC